MAHDHQTQAALAKLFRDFPEIQEKRAYQLMADEYAEAFVTNGDRLDVAISKAGEAVGEEFGLGKYSGDTRSEQRQQHAPPSEDDPSLVIGEMARLRPGAQQAELQGELDEGRDSVAHMAAVRPGGQQA